MIRLDASQPWQISFQEPASLIMESIIDLHDNFMYILIVILTLVGWMLIEILRQRRSVSAKHLRHGTMIEIIWTLTPAIILIFMALPSFKLLYLEDEVIDPQITIKVIGHQWFWSVEYADYCNSSGEYINFDSYMVPTDELEKGELRLLEVDRSIILPSEKMTRFVMTSADVLHSWALPSLGIKVDCCPGRLNQISSYLNRQGVYYGQCSELCGVQHGFMPIKVEVVNIENFIAYLNQELSECQDN